MRISRITAGKQNIIAAKKRSGKRMMMHRMITMAKARPVTIGEVMEQVAFDTDNHQFPMINQNMLYISKNLSALVEVQPSSVDGVLLVNSMKKINGSKTESFDEIKS